MGGPRCLLAQGHPHSPLSLQALQLAVQALVLYCGHQQLHEGTLTAGGLIAFILYQNDAGSSVQVRPGSASPIGTSPFLSLP